MGGNNPNWQESAEILLEELGKERSNIKAINDKIQLTLFDQVNFGFSVTKKMWSF